MTFLRGEAGSVRPDASISKEWIHQSTSKLTKGGLLSDKAVGDLIDVWDTLKEEYRAPHKNSVFNRKVIREMEQRGHTQAHPSQWQKKMGSLLSEFKLYTKSLSRTGQGHPRPWAYYTSLLPILGDMVTVTPELTRAVGATYVTTSNPDLPSSSGEGQRPQSRARPAAASRQDEKRALVQMVVESREKMILEFKEALAALKKD